MSKEIKNVCVYGIGGVGGYFGGRIAHKINTENLNDMEVYFIGRGEHLKYVQEHGLKLITDNDEFNCFPNIATDNIRRIPTPDLYLLCVKGYDLENAVSAISKNVSSHTIIIPLLNGVDIYERIREKLQKAIVTPAAVYVSSSIEIPGTVRQKGQEGQIVFGKDPEYQKYNYQPIAEYFKQIGIKASWFENPYPAIWEKYIFIAPFSLVTAYAGKTIGEVLGDEKLRTLTEQIMNEVILIGNAKNVDFAENIVEETIKKAQGFPYETKTSFQRDYEKGNARHEGDIFGGTLIRMAEENNITVPVIKEIYNKL
ncbi:MAG: 2-dehydropantoate 2-reductase [Candidatus Caldatribacteriota bacterium]